MSGFSTSFANALINYSLRAQPAPTIRTTYFALFTADPTDAFVSANEVSAAWYIRQPTGAFAAPTDGASYNTSNVEFPAVVGTSVTVTHVGIVEGNSASDATATLLYSAELTEPKTYTSGDIATIRTGGTSGDFSIELL